MRISAMLICVTALAIAGLSFAGVTMGQTPTKKKPPPTRTTSPTTGDGAAVVSRADEYQKTSAEIIEPSPQSSPQIITPVSDDLGRRIEELQLQVRRLEAGQKSEYDEKQKRLLLNLDILTKAEQRSESLRKQRFELIEKENSLRSRMDQIDADLRPEVIDRTIALSGSLRPEELRDARRRVLESEKRNIQILLAEIVSTKSMLEQSLLRSDSLVEKLRLKLEVEIEKALEPNEKKDQ